MPRNARIVAPGLPYHVTQRGTNREKVFFAVEDRHLYLRLIRESLAAAQTRVLAYCLMTNHVHFVVVPGHEESLATLFGRANGRYAQAVNIRKGRCGHLWQARFHSCAMSTSHLWAAVKYVEANPCRAGVAKSPEDYRWSSAAPHLRGVPDPGGILDLDFWQRAGGIATWQELHAADLEESQMRVLRRCTYAGMPFGGPEFLEEMESRFRRQWRPPAGSAHSVERKRAVSA
jgi:putative transposase